MTRRTFLSSAAAAASVRPSQSATSSIPLGYDTYSIRAWGWKAMQHLDYAAKLRLDAVQLSGIGDFESLEPAFLSKVRDRARELNLILDGGTGCICPTAAAWGKRTDDPVEYLGKAIGVAQAIGTRCVRVFVGSNADRFRDLPLDAHIESTVKVLRACRSRAMDANLRIAIENHGDFQARELLTLIETAGKEYVGACLDTGNPLHVLEDPVTTLEVLGPVAVTTHYRDGCVYEHPRGVAVQWTAMGEGSVDFPRVVALHEQFCPKAPLHLEIITGRPPLVFPYHERDFWKGYPNAHAAGFARFVALAKRGQPFSGSMVIADVPGPRPPEFQEALKVQQKRDLERSFEYVKNKLGAGRVWRTAR